MNSMNVTINKDISKIHDSVVWGIPLRETILGGATIVIAIASHFMFADFFDNSKLVNILTAIACFPTGFLTVCKYQGLTGEKIIIEVLHSIFMKKTLVLTPENEYSDMVKDLIKEKQKEDLKIDKIRKKDKKRKKAELQSTKKSTGHNPVQQDI